jgi:chaperonin GroEL (HSP60 family)
MRFAIMAAKLATVNEQILDNGERSGESADGSNYSSRDNENPRTGRMQFDCGYLSPFFITDPERMEVVLENAYILPHQGKITSKNDLIPLLKQFTNKGKSLLIIAEDVEGEALATLVVKKVSGFLQVAAVSASGLGNQRKSLLHDIALLTGGKAMQGLDTRLKNIQISDLGQAKKVIIDKNRTVIESGAIYHHLCSHVPLKSFPAADSSQHGKQEYSSARQTNV